MASQQKDFIKISLPEESPQTKPVDPAKRLAVSEIKIELADEKDAYRFAEGLYLSFTEASRNRVEPLHLRPATQEICIERQAKRIQPSISEPGVYWVKAVHIPSSTIIGAASWAGPTLPVHNISRRSAFTFYGWQEKMGWSDAELDELFAHVDDEAWSGTFIKNDEVREKLVPEPHWYLTTLFTWPEWQGRGVAKRLLSWAIDQADATEPPTPLYLESSDLARAIYTHVGFVPQGPKNFLRRGPKVLGEVEAEAKDKKIEKVDIEAVANELEADMAS